MQSGYYDAAGGMVTQFNKLNVITNNLANVNTNGFKADNVVIGDFERIFSEKRDVLPHENHTEESAQFLNRALNKVPHIVEGYTDFSSGSIKQTGNDLDFALKQENAFFLVKTPNGIRATKDGSFEINDEGHVVTKDGYPVLPKTYFTDGHLLTIQPNYELKGDYDGNLYQNGLQVSSFYVAKFENIKTLEKEGDNLYKYPDDQNAPLLNETDVMKQGFLEKSNINPVTAMTNLIETQRLVDMYQKVMDSQMNDMNNDAISKLASIRA
jgi:flagellar basal-body rod protein FlgG